MERKKSRWISLFAVLAIVAVMVGVPIGLFGVSDTLLFAAPQPRSTQGGELAVRPQDIYMVGALHTLQQAEDAGNNVFYSESMDEAKREALQSRTSHYMQALYEAKVLPKVLWEYASRQLTRAEMEFNQNISPYGYESVSYTMETEEGYFWLQYTVEMKTEKIVQMDLFCGDNAPYLGVEEFDRRQALEHYLTYIGLAALPDWVLLAAEEVYPNEPEGGELAFSMEAELAAGLEWKVNTNWFSVYAHSLRNLTEEEMQQSEWYKAVHSG